MSYGVRRYNQKLWSYLLLTVLLTSACALAGFEVNGDGSSVDYSKIGVSARYWGMGKAGVAFADDSGGVLINPAAYGVMRSLEVGMMNTKVLGTFEYMYASGVWPLKYETMGFTLLNENPGEIKEASEVDEYGHPLEGGKLQAYSQMMTFGYGRKAFLENLYLGGVIKYQKKRLAFIEASVAALDLGALYRWDQDLAFGLTVKNVLQNSYNYSSAGYRESLTPEVTLGGAWTLLNKSFVLAYDRTISTNFGKNNIGMEYWLANMVALRAGLAERDLTMGIGFKYELFRADFGMRFQDAPLENQIYMSVSWGNASSFLMSKPEIEIVEAVESKETSLVTTTARTPVKRGAEKSAASSAESEIQVVE